MKKHRTLLMALVAGVVSAGIGVNTAVQADARDDKIKLSGCLIKADEGDGFLITNLPSEPGSASAGDRRVTTDAIGTAGSFSPVFYWLGDNDDLKKNVGRRVEVEGELKGDIKEGEIKLEPKDNWTELQVKSDGHSMKAKVPNAYIFPDATREKDRKISAMVRKVDVDHVKMVSASCQ